MLVQKNPTLQKQALSLTLPASELALVVHDVQLVMPSPKNPALQMQAPTFVLPAGELVLAIHAWQLEEPGISWYLPVGQRAQVLAEKEYFPASHELHSRAPKAALTYVCKDKLVDLYAPSHLSCHTESIPETSGELLEVYAFSDNTPS